LREDVEKKMIGKLSLQKNNIAETFASLSNSEGRAYTGAA
jgi:hypothetical protein